MVIDREFDFLPNLPKSRLDDRSFDDLVQECILRIPRYCPEWTNHNPGDPGITLIELFSWLVDQMLRRFNQVPRRHYITFLELLGMRLKPPQVAQAEVTFYLVKAQNSPLKIAQTTEVATVRTETESAVIFTTDTDLVIGQPKIQALLTACTSPQQPDLDFSVELIDRDVQWHNLGGVTLFENCELGNCFYLVLTPTRAEASNGNEPIADSIAGNVIALTCNGIVAGTTGIDPNHPPLEWQAWDGERWRSEGILRQRQDDKTKGFSFHELSNLSQQGADIILHLPIDWAEADFGTPHRGYWIRCVYKQSGTIYTYNRSPQILSLSVRSIGGTIQASECVRIENEFLGVSDGKPGQSFTLQNFPILDRLPTEHIRVKLPDGRIENWQEVKDFADSDARSPHYLLDRVEDTVSVQFGPLIREPSQLQRLIQERDRLQSNQTMQRRSPLPAIELPAAALDSRDHLHQEWQYGRVPPLGAEIYMTAYRAGGGSRGNVKAGKLTVVKTAIPYVKQVVNYHEATGGKDAETLDDMVMRVPQVLRTSKAAVTPEDFENTARGADQSIYRAFCPPVRADQDDRGVVRILLLINPTDQPDPRAIDWQDFPLGMQPDRDFAIPASVRETTMAAIDRRKPLGIQIKLDTPQFVGVKVRAIVRLQPQYSTPALRSEMQRKISSVLYRFLNPLTGGFDQQGWALGNPVSTIDIATLLQLPEVSVVGAIELFRVEKHPQQGWVRSRFAQTLIDPGAQGLICSWDDQGGALDCGHEVTLL